jgi:hypothetical protein
MAISVILNTMLGTSKEKKVKEKIKDSVFLKGLKK